MQNEVFIDSQKLFTICCVYVFLLDTAFYQNFRLWQGKHRELAAKVPMRERHECHCMLFLKDDNPFASAA